MSDLKETNQFQIPIGLPNRLVSPHGGFERLCELLDIETTRQKLAILRAPFVKSVFSNISYKNPSKAKQSERIRKGLTAFYSDPDARRSLWRSHLEGEENLDPSSAPIPSLELEALRALDEGLVGDEFEMSDTEEKADFYSAGAIHDEWRHAAIVAIDRIKDEIQKWEALPDPRKIDLLNGAFAAATILDDVRILEWVIDCVETAGKEYAFLSKPDSEGDSGTDTTSAPNTDNQEEEQSPLDRLKTEALYLSAAALELTTKLPSQDLFDDIANHAENVAELREPAIRLLELNTPKGKFQSFKQQIQEKSAQLTWLTENQDRILKSWRESYDLEQSDESDRLIEDLERATKELVDGITNWLEVDQKFREVEAALRHVQKTNSGTGDLHQSRETFELSQRYGELGQERLDVQDQILKSLRPTEVSIDHPTEPTEPSGTIETNSDVNRISPAQSDSQVVTVEESTTGPEEEPAEELSESPAETDDLAVWTALDCGRLGNAYHIARLNEETREGRVRQPNSDLLALLAIGSEIQGREHQLVLDFGRRISSVLASLDLSEIKPSATRDALSLLVFSASMRPALFAGQDGAITLLKRVELSNSLTPVYKFAEIMVNHATQLKNIQLDGATLTALLNEDVWRERWDRHFAKVEHWNEAAVPKFYGYKPVREVWRHWIGSNGKLSRLGELIARDSESSSNQVEKILHEFTTGTLQELVNNTWRNELDKKGGKFSGKVLLQVERHLKEPLRLAYNWLQLTRSKPRGRADWVQTAIERLRNDIQSYGKTALNALRNYQSASPDIKLKAALRLTEKAIASAEETLLRPDESNGSVFSGEHDLLSRDLVLVKDLALNAQGEIDGSISSSSARKLLASVEDYASSPIEAFHQRLNQNDLCGAQAALKSMEFQVEPRVAEFEEMLNSEFAKRSRELHRRLDDFTEKLEPLFIVGEVPHSKYLSLVSQTETARKLIESDGNDSLLDAIGIVGSAESKLTDIENATEKKFESQIRKYTEKLTETDKPLLREALVNKDLIALHEYIDCIQANRPLVAAHIEECRSLEHFLSLVNHIDQQGSLSAMTVLDAIRTSKSVDGIDYSALSESQSNQSASLVEAWLLMARQRKQDDKLLVQLLQGLGFDSVSTSYSSKSKGVVEIKTTPLRDRDLCPVYSYGSEAEGKYNLILNWSTDLQSSVLQAVRSDANSHLIVLHFGHISNDERWQLRSWSVRNSIPFIVIDDTLLFFLASVASRRLRKLFDCTLPFTCIEPFFTAAGLLPPESFYGRDSERSKILARYGSCFVYGGRQLGKTALLRSAEKSFHSPEKHEIAICIDLKQHGVGIESGAEDIWRVLARHLIQHNVMPSSVSRLRRRDNLIPVLDQHIRNWVAEESNGRILLLLDEADAFLANDLKNNFQESNTLKGFMDATDRKFKVVLCGLHNVLRTTERANHPLAHFGEPICVGAFLTDGEREQAHALVREPLAAAGYVFENHGLVYHILARTNYYPSLLQIYGEHLVRHMRSSNTLEMPGVIRARDLDAVFGSEQISDFIKGRFALTLQLDDRYEVIAYTLAHELHVDPAGPGRYSAKELLDLVRIHWPEGFAISLLEFETLLREMHGLGVLRQYVNGNAISAEYALRNPNVRLLLGNAEHVEGVLENERIPRELFEAAHNHAQYPGDDATSPRRGPLTFEQEALLKRGGRIAVLCGTQLANLNELGEFLRQRMMDTQQLNELEPCQSAEELAQTFTKLRQDRITTVCLVNENDPYNVRWIEHAIARIRDIKVGHRLRIVFVAGTEQLWNLIEDLHIAKLPEPLNSRLDWICVSSWNKSFLLQWCRDQNLHEAVDHIDELFEITGGWPTLLEDYAKLSSLGWQEKSQQMKDYIEKNTDELVIRLGLDSPQCIIQMKALSGLSNLVFEEISAYEELLIEEGEIAIQPGSLHQRLQWAIRLGLIEDQEGEIQLNPLVRQVVLQAAK